MSAKLIKALGNCPGLCVGDAGLVWRDSLGRDHLLANCARLTIGEAANRLRVDERTIRRRLAAGEIYPAAKFAGVFEIYAVGIDDHLARATVRAHAGKEAANA